MNSLNGKWSQQRRLFEVASNDGIPRQQDGQEGRQCQTAGLNPLTTGEMVLIRSFTQTTRYQLPLTLTYKWEELEWEWEGEKKSERERDREEEALFKRNLGSFTTHSHSHSLNMNQCQGHKDTACPCVRAGHQEQARLPKRQGETN